MLAADQTSYAAKRISSSMAMVSLFGFGGRDVADGLEQTPMVQPVLHYSVADSRL